MEVLRKLGQREATGIGEGDARLRGHWLLPFYRRKRPRGRASSLRIPRGGDFHGGLW